MKKRAIIECGVAQTRAALLIGDDVWKFWFGPAIGDEATDIFPAAGRRFAGRVRRVDLALNAVFVDLGEGADGFLPLKKSIEARCHEGALNEVEIKSPPRQGKGPQLRFVGDAPKESTPGRLPPFVSPVIEAAQMIGADADEIIVDQGAARVLLEQAGFQHVTHDGRGASLFEKHGAEAQLSNAFNRAVPLKRGGHLFIDEAQALTAIDVDTGTLGALSSERLREKISVAAADEAIRQLSLRDIGGQIVIDFPPISGEGARKRFQERLWQSMARLEATSAAGFAKSGLFCFTKTHKQRSMLERFTQSSSAEPVAGRVFTVEAKTVAAMTALEARLRSAPTKDIQLAVGSALAAHLESQPQWTERLTHLYGARFQIDTTTGIGERDFDLSE